MYGDIGDYKDWLGDEACDISAKRIAAELKAIGAVSEITVHINSPGGSVTTAQAIYSLLRSNSAKVVVKVDGIAASAASIIAMAGDEIIMPENSMMMIHSPMCCAYGNPQELKKNIEALEKVQLSMIAVYKRSGQSEEEIKNLLEAETWLTASEAVDLGFADKMDGSVEVTASLEGDQAILACGDNRISFASSRYRKVPDFFVPKAQSKTTGETGPEAVVPETKDSKKEDEIVDLEELKAKYPDIYKAAMEEGVKVERNRIKAIDDMGVIAQGKLGVEAKFEKPCAPETLAMRIVTAQAAQGKSAHSALMADASELEGVKTAVPEGAAGGDTTAEETEAFVASFGAGFGGAK